MTDALIRPLLTDEIDRVRPLWEQLIRHHGDVAPHLPPIRDPAESWRVRREKYRDWLSLPPSFALVAEIDERPVGYITVRVESGDDTWEMGERMAEIETLVVDSAARRRGIAGALVREVVRRLDELDIHDTIVEVVSTNTEAIAFYKARGFGSFQLKLYRRG